MPLNKSQPLFQWLALIQAPGIGSRTTHDLLRVFGSAEAICNASEQQLLKAGLNRTQTSSLLNPDQNLITSSLDWLSHAGNGLITWTDEDYPALLREIADPPVALFTKGDTEMLRYPGLAIVGSRNPTRNGRQNAIDFSRFFAQNGLCVISGLASGIDAASHLGALEADGMTVAVTGTGLDRIYPASNRDLAHRIKNKGLLLSEYPPGTPPLPANFPRRNRIISGLSLGTLVVEAAEKSGSLITARLASEQGREVFAIPGSIHNPLARGCHYLIRQGAKLVDSAEHIIEELAPILIQQNAITVGASDKPESGGNTNLDNDYLRLLETMEYDPIGINELIEISGLTPESVSSMLLLLELKGYVESLPGGRYSRIPFSSN